MSGEEFNLGQVHEAVAATVPDRECIVWRDRRYTYADITDRSRRLASFLYRHGFGVHAERSTLAGHQSGQDHLGLYLYNGNEYLEGMLGAYKARVAPFNVNYRYVEEELRYLLRDAKARGLVYHATFAPILERILPELRDLELLIQVADESDEPLLPGAVDYETALASAAPELPPSSPRPTTSTSSTPAAPRACRRASSGASTTSSGAAMGGRTYGTWELIESTDHLVSRVLPADGVRVMSIPPLMHGAAQWASFYYMTMGATLVFPTNTRTMDPVDVWQTVEREKIIGLSVVGDAMARPLVEELERGDYDTKGFLAFGSGGAMLSEGMKTRILAQLPNIVVSDVAGASETGAQMGTNSTSGSVSTGRLRPGTGGHRRERGPHPGAQARRRGARLAGPEGIGPPRLPGRRGEDGPDLPGDREGPLLRSRRPGPLPG